jgi:hypothetical protein
VDQRQINGLSRGHRLKGDLDVDGQAGRTALIGLKSVAETAVVVGVTSEDVDNPRAGSALEAGSKQALLQEPALAQEKLPSSSEPLVHDRDGIGGVPWHRRRALITMAILKRGALCPLPDRT